MRELAQSTYEYVQKTVPAETKAMCVLSLQQMLHVVLANFNTTFSPLSHRGVQSVEDFWFDSNLLTNILYALQ
jgi:hypothetical protein